LNNGNYIKKIRTNKGFTQTYVAKNILSQASYSKFESGHSDINSYSFVQLLNKLDMTLEEAVYINNNYKYDKTQELVNRFFALPYNDVSSLRNLLSDIQIHLQINKNILLIDITLICKALITLRTKRDIGQARKIVEPVWKRLSKSNQWYLVDIRVINTILYLFPNDIALEVTENVLSKLDLYKGFQDTIRLSITFRVNLSLLLIKEKDYSKALQVLTKTLEDYKKAMPYQSLAICLGRIAICKKKLGKVDALYSMKQAEQVLIIYEEMDLWKNIIEEYRYYTDDLPTIDT